MRNLRTKVSQAYDGKCDRAVIDIMKDKDYLDSKKKLHVNLQVTRLSLSYQT